MIGLVTFIAFVDADADPSLLRPVTLPANGIAAVQQADEQTCIVTDGNGFDWQSAESHKTVCARWSEQLRYWR
jgi:hypothetical protein